jgi:hypothetical protein
MRDEFSRLRGESVAVPRPAVGHAPRPVELRIPKLRKSSYFPGFLEPAPEREVKSASLVMATRYLLRRSEIDLSGE